ncbi:MAG: hypothetical protein JO322_04255 [Candidatus Eremiobacteraeota bacterium]|nr:hypothetical protein [Candidatus Eremiobacteraeota bacterium]
MERLLRFETLIAICALLISAITGAAVVYQTHIIQSEYAATIWPYLSVDTFVTNQRRVDIKMTNDGLGPALIRSAQLVIDGKRARSWEDLESIVRRDARGRVAFGSSSINASTTIRPGESHQLISANLAPDVSPDILARHRVVLTFCYCSLNDSCWSLHSVPGVVGGEFPHQVSSCRIDEGIATKLY